METQVPQVSILSSLCTEHGSHGMVSKVDLALKGCRLCFLSCWYGMAANLRSKSMSQVKCD